MFIAVLPVPKDVRLNTTFFIIKIGIDSKDFIELYRKCAAKLYSIVVIDTTLLSDNPLRFWKNLLEEIESNNDHQLSNQRLKITI